MKLESPRDLPPIDQSGVSVGAVWSEIGSYHVLAGMVTTLRIF